MLQGFARKKQRLAGAPMPDFWREDVGRVLAEVYHHQILAMNMQLAIWGEVYADEILVIASISDQNNPARIPTSFYISADPVDESKADALVKKMVDAIGLRFDDFFSVEHWQDYHDAWQVVTVGKVELFTKSNRENIALTMQANQILSAAGLDPDADPY